MPKTRPPSASTNTMASAYCPAMPGASVFLSPRPFASLTVPLLLRPDPQRLHLPIQITALQPEQLRGTRHIPVRLFQLLQNVLALRRFAHLLQTAEAIQRTLDRFARTGQWNVARVDTHL